ncbi:Hypothetical protein R9X50_00300000 [Acrodontium crateriforme]|uniref:Uncharacterized protein n=1 Tax=Acrodontium crateriforme TaxID=150365 RepID=A0AAQ3M1W0_9PEZI|nr:Hypothetical protein R9X50_00300000 [Acrodontium crateriforme]
MTPSKGGRNLQKDKPSALSSICPNTVARQSASDSYCDLKPRDLFNPDFKFVNQALSNKAIKYFIPTSFNSTNPITRTEKERRDSFELEMTAAAIDHFPDFSCDQMTSASAWLSRKAITPDVPTRDIIVAFECKSNPDVKFVRTSNHQLFADCFDDFCRETRKNEDILSFWYKGREVLSGEKPVQVDAKESLFVLRVAELSRKGPGKRKRDEE